uniref:Uncharacterized protein n=1 Tax=Anopheles christyi TaxID=43041 RepID=A0A182KI68_9DIPT
MLMKTLFINIFLVGDILNNVGRFEKLFRVAIRNFKTEFVFHGHYHLDVIQ